MNNITDKMRTLLKIGSGTIDLSAPVAMGIINVTPDSFYSESRNSDLDKLEARIARKVHEGAAILDIGGYSSRPGAAEVDTDEEIRRVWSAVEIARRLFPDTVVSVDTFRSEVIRAVVERYGAVMVNDISAGEADEDMIPTVARLQLPYIAMHMRGTPATMNCPENLKYEELTKDISDYFSAKIEQCRSAGIENIIIDPGFGFSKDVEQNYALLKDTHKLLGHGCPILGGISRKSMIWKPLGITPCEALNGTSALNWELLRQGVSILRVHDVREAVEIIKMFNLYESAK